MLKKILTIFFFSFFLATTVSAYTSPGAPSGFVNDFAGVINDDQLLENDLSAFEQETGHEIAVVIIKTLDGDYIENYAVELFSDWKIGKKGADNGILFLVAIEDREMRIEVGYGLEGALTDLQSKAILEQVVKPYFQSGNYEEGIVAGVGEIKKAIKGESLNINLDYSEDSSLWETIGSIIFFFAFVVWRILFHHLGKSKAIWPGAVIGAFAGAGLLGLIIGTVGAAIGGAIILGLLGLLMDWGASHKGWFKHSGKGGTGGFWGGGSSGGGGFGGFGGGSSGGGGSSSSW